MTKRKFLEQPLKRQHKKSAEALRSFFENGDKETLNRYRELQEWMELTPLSCYSKEALSNRYHFHLKQAGLQQKEHNLLPKVETGDKKEAKPLLPITIYLDHIRSAHNVGSIVRTTEAFSLGKLALSADTPSLEHKQVKDAAMGACGFVTATFDSIDALPKPLIALETAENATSLTEFIFPKSFTLALGNEEYGLSKEVLSKADYFVKIPLRGRKNSLNVANAFAVAAAEIARQNDAKCA